MNINKERLKERIDAVNRVSKDESGGYTRLAYSETDRLGRNLVMKMMEEAGLDITYDEVGNIIGTYECGEFPGYVSCGSHVDTVKNGGAYDGLLGSIAAIEVLQTAKEQKLKLKHPLRAIIFSDEEGARFGAGLIGSKYVAGTEMELPLDAYVDEAGISLYQALKDFDLDPDELVFKKPQENEYKAFIELHIEQSTVLESKSKQIGVVSGIKGPIWLRGEFIGEPNHAGGTPMSGRKDALIAAAKLVGDVEKIALEMGGDFVATVGSMKVFPGGINTIPGSVTYTVDIRDMDMERREAGVERIIKAAEQVATDCGAIHHVDMIKNEPSVNMAPEIIEQITKTCVDKGVDYMTLPSGPLHDAMQMSTICSAGMIFVPSIAGISHSPKEDTEWKDIYTGAEVLYETIVRLAT